MRSFINSVKDASFCLPCISSFACWVKYTTHGVLGRLGTTSFSSAFALRALILSLTCCSSVSGFFARAFFAFTTGAFVFLAVFSFFGLAAVVVFAGFAVALVFFAPTCSA